MYVILGASGNVGSGVANRLLSKGLPVKVVGRDAARLEPWSRKGAHRAVGDLSDRAFLSEVFRGAHGVFTMLPPQYADPAPMRSYARLGEAIAWALEKSAVRRVVNLSSIGAHLPHGTGPIAALHAQEARLDQIGKVDVLHVRPGYFYENHLGAIGTILAHGAYCDMIPADLLIPMQAAADISAVVARALTDQGGESGTRVLHLHGPRRYTMSHAAAVLGAAIGKPGLPYIQTDSAQVKAGMIQHGFSPAMADLFEEMSLALAMPALSAELERGPSEMTPTPLEAIAPAFRAVFEGASKHDARHAPAAPVT